MNVTNATSNETRRNYPIMRKEAKNNSGENLSEMSRSSLKVRFGFNFIYFFPFLFITFRFAFSAHFNDLHVLILLLWCAI